MKITNIKLTNYRGFENLDFSLVFRENDKADQYWRSKEKGRESLAVFIGENGAGKSSLMNAIRWILKHTVASFFPETPNEELAINDIRLGADQVAVEVKLEEGYDVAVGDNLSLDTFEFFYSKFRFSRNDDQYNYSSKGIEQFRNKLKNEAITEYDNLPVFSYYGPVTNFEYKKQKTNYTESSRLNVYLNALDGIGDFSDFEQWFITEQADERELQYQKKDFNYEKTTVSNVRNAIEYFMKRIGVSTFGKVSVAKSPHNTRSERLMMLIEKNGNKFPIINLSDGERKILHMVGDLARRCIMATPYVEGHNFKYDFQTTKGVVLIDEIDQHLHPKWQKNIVRALSETFSSIQFLITTHSPLILSDLPKEYVYSIDDFKVSQENIYTEGRSIEHILKDVQGVEESLRSEEDRKKINKFYQLLDEKDGIDEAKKIYQELFVGQFGENDPESVTAKRDLEFAEWELNEGGNEKD